MRRRKQPQRAKIGNRVRTTIYIDADVLHIAKEDARRRGISFCDWSEDAFRLKLAITQLATISEHKKGGLTVKSIVVHKVERLGRNFKTSRESAPKQLLCPNCGSSDIVHAPLRTPFSYNGSYYECIRCRHYFSRWG